MSKDPSPPAPAWLIRLIWAVVFFALLRNLLPPNAFTATVLIFDYEFGLVRRGFLGEALNLYWGNTVSKGEVFAASAVLTLLGVAALLTVFGRFCLHTLTGAKLFLLLVSSFAFAALISSTGYIDLALIVFVALVMHSAPVGMFGISARIGAVILGVFMHEVMLAYFAVFFVFELHFGKTGKPRLPVAMLPLIAAFGAFGLLTALGQLSPQEAQGYIAHIEAKSEFTAEPEATIVMERTLSDNMAMMSEKRGMLDYRSWVIFDGLPLLAMSIWLLWLNLKLMPSASMLTRVLLLGAIAAPLSLNVIAFDVVRFGSISVLVGFLAVLVQLRTDPETEHRLASLLSWPTMTVLLVLNLNVTVNQMNTGDGQDYAVPWVLVKQLDWIK